MLIVAGLGGQIAGQTGYAAPPGVSQRGVLRFQCLRPKELGKLIVCDLGTWSLTPVAPTPRTGDVMEDHILLSMAICWLDSAPSAPRSISMEEVVRNSSLPTGLRVPGLSI